MRVDTIWWVNLISAIERVICLVPTLLAVAFVTLSERKVLASLQRRVGPNSVGVRGWLQAFRDALKLVRKETVIPFRSYPILLVLSPAFALTCSIGGFVVIPFRGGTAPI
jgi:NADH-ubiquinone oxidoreductase chain 1